MRRPLAHLWTVIVLAAATGAALSFGALPALPESQTSCPSKPGYVCYIDASGVCRCVKLPGLKKP